MRISYSSPKLNLLVTSPAGDVYEFANKELGGDVMAFSCNTQIKSIGGGFNFTIVPRRVPAKYRVMRLRNLYRNEDWSDVFVPRTKVDCYLNGVEVFIGLVGAVTIQRDAASASVTITVSGLSIASILQQFSLIIHKTGGEPSWSVPALAKQSLIGELQNRTSPAAAMSGAYHKWMSILANGFASPKAESLDSGLGQFKFADGTAVEDLVVVDTPQDGGALSEVLYANQIYYRQSLDVYDGNLWGYFQECLSTPMNEIFCDCGDRSVRLYDPKWILAPGVNIGATRESTAGSTKLERLNGFRSKVSLDAGKVYVVARPTPWDDRRLGIDGNNTGATMKRQVSFVTAQSFLEDLYIAATDPTRMDAMALTDDDVYSTSLMRSDNNISTSWQLRLQAHLLISTGLNVPSPPMYHAGLTATYGHRPFMGDLKGADVGKAILETRSGGRGVIKSDYVWMYQRKLKDWMQWNDKYMSGSISTYMNPFIRIGQWLWYSPSSRQRGQSVSSGGGGVGLRDEHRYYYVEGVTHNYNYEKHSATTSVSVSRGTPLDAASSFTREIPQTAIWINKWDAPDAAAKRRAKQRQKAIHRRIVLW